jgi:hypothetical protein
MSNWGGIKKRLCSRRVILITLLRNSFQFPLLVRTYGCLLKHLPIELTPFFFFLHFHYGHAALCISNVTFVKRVSFFLSPEHESRPKAA